MEKQINENEITASQIIDMKLDDFKYFVEEGHMPVGVASNYKFFLSSQYSQTVILKDSVVKEMGNKTGDDKEALKCHVQNLYLLLLDLESKIGFLEQYIKDKM